MTHRLDPLQHTDFEVYRPGEKVWDIATEDGTTWRIRLPRRGAWTLAKRPSREADTLHAHSPLVVGSDLVVEIETWTQCGSGPATWDLGTITRVERVR